MNARRPSLFACFVFAAVGAAPSAAFAQDDPSLSYRPDPEAVPGAASSAAAPTAPVAGRPALAPAPGAASTPSTALADDDPIRSSPELTHKQWYGWETLLVDAGALTAMIAGASAQSTAVGVTGLTAYAIGPTVVHAARGNGEAAAEDVVMRVLLPIATGTAGYVIDYSTSAPCNPQEWLCIRGLGGAAVGVLAGYAGAIVIDAAALSWDRAPVHPERAASTRVRWAPTVGATPQGATAGVAGAF